MNLTPRDSTIIEELRYFIKDHILPRITNLEEEVKLLREVTWPVCQSIRETSQLEELPQKKEFLRNLDIDEARCLLFNKSRLYGRPTEFSTHQFLHEETSRTLTHDRRYRYKAPLAPLPQDDAEYPHSPE